MKIWFDAQCLQSSSVLRGIGRYSLGLLNAFAEQLGPKNVHASVNAQLLNEALLAKQILMEILPESNIHFWHGIASSSKVENLHPELRQLSEIALAQHVLNLSPDFAICASPFEGMTDQLVPFTPTTQYSVPTAAIFYDAIPHRYPKEYLPTKPISDAYYETLRKHQDYKVLWCISDYVKSEAKSLFPQVNAVNINAGVDPLWRSSMSSEIEAGSDSKRLHSVLYVGGADPRKNLATLIDAIAILDRQHDIQVELQIVGDHPMESKQTLEQTWSSAALDPAMMRLLGYLSETDLQRAFRETYTMVLPSLLEGFGLTALEALVTGGRILVSNTGALPEVVGNPALLFDPHSAESIAERLLWAIENPQSFHEASVAARTRAEKYTWPNSAKTAIEVMDEIRTAQVTCNSQKPLKAAHEILLNETDLNLLSNVIGVDQKRNAVLHVDITSTAKIDHKSGIQRVVRKLFERGDRLAGDHWLQYTFVGCHQPEGFFETTLDSLEDRGENWDANADKVVPVGKADTILMLDSSWEYHEQQEKTLKLARLNGVQVISVLYDLVPLRFSGFCDQGMPIIFGSWLQSALQYSTGFVCISRAVADEFYNLLKAIKYPRQMNIGYWHLGADFNVKEALPTEPMRENSRQDKQFLSVGTIEPRKGQSVILDAFELLWREGHKDKLSFVGKPGWGVSSFIDRLKTHPELGQRLFWHSGMTDEALEAEYRNCDALIAASFGEGFGLPIVEAQQRGKPIIASELDVFREISGGGAGVTFFKTGSPGDLARAISNFNAEEFQTPDLSHVLNWDESADALHEVISGRDWYKVYPGINNTAHSFRHPIGALHTNDRVFDADLSENVLELVGERALDLFSPEESVVVKAKNTSSDLWSSHGSEPVTLRVMGDKQTDHSTPTSIFIQIPLVIPPDDEQYFYLGTARELKGLAEKRLEVSFWQEKTGRIGLPLILQV